VIVALTVITAMSFKQWSYEKMTETLLSNSIEQIRVSSDELDDYTIIDTRSEAEFEVSHLPGAIRVNPDSEEFSQELLNSKKPLLVYCSVGLRSEKIGERILKQSTIKEVYNLKGGFFQWFNDKKPIVDFNGKSTTEIHTYNKAWSIWVCN
tara:strand:- start:251 stop:703 length:453 start_codon:yes stop_codon:yes gene_type:complete